MSNLYSYPYYYDIAFSFRDIPKEVDVFEACFRRFSTRPLQSVLELGCGNGPHMEELLRRGYTYRGLDLSPEMLDFSRRKAGDAGYGEKAEFFQADMNRFSLPIWTDFVFIALGSLYARNRDDLAGHFASVASVLYPGGLYLMDWCVTFSPLETHEESWEMERGEVKVKASFQNKPVDAAEQLYEETLRFDILDRGVHKTVSSSEVRRMIFPQEFLLLVEKTGQFEFQGWFDDWKLDKPIEGPGPFNRPIAILKRV